MENLISTYFTSNNRKKSKVMKSLASSGGLLNSTKEGSVGLGAMSRGDSPN
jgi:hypothetical protein